MDVQRGTAERNLDIADEQRIDFRVGINLGDIMIDAEDIHGDGVNIAARLEGIAEPGSICLSDSAYQQVRNKLAIDFGDMGEQQLKNIARPVRTFRITPPVIVQPTAPAKPDLALPDKPSLAVLPFPSRSRRRRCSSTTARSHSASISSNSDETTTTATPLAASTRLCSTNSGWAS